MRYWKLFILIYTTLTSSKLSVAAGALLPDCADACYRNSSGGQAQCTFAHNDCTCGTNAVSSAIQGCVLQTCAIKNWLTTMNATDTVCDRPVRNGGHVLVICAAVLGSLAFLALLIRIFVAVRQHSFGYDDLFACLAGCMSVPNSIGLAISARIGLGRDIWTLTPFEITRVQKVIYICQNFYFWCSGFQKLCFLFFFLRIFPFESTRRWCFAGIALSIGYAAGFGLAMTFACWPIPAIWTAWTMEEKPTYCIDQNLFYYCAAAANISSDLMIAIIPIPQLWKLKLTLKKKLLLSAIFGVGFIIITISCLRVRTLTRYSNTTNPTYDTLASAVWSNVELNEGVICICMPAFRRFLAHTLPRWFGSTEDSLSLHDEARPKSDPSSSGKKGSRRRSTLPGSLFGTTVMTTNTQISTLKPQEDEQQLADMNSNKDTAESDADAFKTVSDTERQYKAQHQATLPMDWQESAAMSYNISVNPTDLEEMNGTTALPRSTSALFGTGAADDQDSITSSQRPLLDSDRGSITISAGGSKMSKLQKLNPFAKSAVKETPQEKETRLAEEKRKKELIRKYGYTRPQTEDIGALGSRKGTRREGSILAAGAFAAGGGCGA
ncbi:hypothetical protein OPT61_g8678 [Boeremia exigua]|uniref:Uncharacterized protein n=1 Tax=Boeremia exigua TaxID=749465 RepID=A0ACC2HXL9_9PLEO|nr:hypothetical protein OPT61_g8678 [Boeremia exigua]